MPARVGAMADIPNVQPLHYVLKDVGGLKRSSLSRLRRLDLEALIDPLNAVIYGSRFF